MLKQGTDTDPRCAECHQPLRVGEEWVCEECCPEYLIWLDPNGRMTSDDEPDNSR